jgi:D-aminopeptidase
MKIYISADVEGETGVIQIVDLGSPFSAYERHRILFN